MLRCWRIIWGKKLRTVDFLSLQTEQQLIKSHFMSLDATEVYVAISLLFWMVNGKRTVFMKHFSNLLTSTLQQKSAFHTLIAGGLLTTWQPAHQDLTQTHSHTQGTDISSNLGFIFLPKDTLTWNMRSQVSNYRWSSLTLPGCGNLQLKR